MSVTFSVRGERPNWETGEGFVNLANENARQLLYWLGYDGSTLWGQVRARELAARCRDRVRLVAANIDPARAPKSYVGTGGCHVFVGGRAEGYLHDRCADLLDLAECAGDGVIEYS
jgi:hypothetical protein